MASKFLGLYQRKAEICIVEESAYPVADYTSCMVQLRTRVITHRRCYHPFPYATLLPLARCTRLWQRRGQAIGLLRETRAMRPGSGGIDIIATEQKREDTMRYWHSQ